MLAGTHGIIVGVPVGLVFQYELPDTFLDKPGTRAGFVLLGAFLCSFLFIRTSARLMRSPRVPWWPGSVTTESGLHLHHLVWGIVLILLSGFLGFAINPVSPWNEILAAAFGVGAGFTLDEFALWVYLRDVYWAQEGRRSFDAVVVATVLGLLVLLGLAPFNVKGNSSSIVSLIIAVSVDLALALVVILKGKPLLGLACIFVPIIAPFGILRLGLADLCLGAPLLSRRRPFDAPLDRPLEANRCAPRPPVEHDRGRADRDHRRHRARLIFFGGTADAARLFAASPPQVRVQIRG